MGQRSKVCPIEMGTRADKWIIINEARGESIPERYVHVATNKAVVGDDGEARCNCRQMQ